ncbi:UbiH/UbiF family hydroxylase, partial [Xanthomonas perforans]
MSRRSTRDAVIVGGGVVGAAGVLALNDAGMCAAVVVGRGLARGHVG